VLSENYWGVELEGSYWWLRGYRKQMTVGESIVWICMFSDPDWMLRGIERDGSYWLV